jgi:hypothetical protein
VTYSEGGLTGRMGKRNIEVVGEEGVKEFKKNEEEVGY